MPEIVTLIDALDPNLIEAARSQLAVYDKRMPDLAALATVASLARSIEPELLRALRVELGSRISGSRISVSAESRLWFSDFVESRGSDAITLLPEVLQVLRPRLVKNPQLMEDVRSIIENCHQGAPEVLQWEERIVYLALTGKTSLMEEEVLRGLNSISKGTRQPLVSWITDMWLRLPPEASSNPLVAKLLQVASGLMRRKTQAWQGQPSSATDLVLDFSDFPTRELGVVFRNERFVIGDVPDAEFGIQVPDLEPVELDISFGVTDAWREQRTIEPGQTAEVHVGQSPSVRLRTLAGRIYELRSEFFRPPAKRFAVALNFPSEFRDFVEKVAGYLASHFGTERVLYDKYHEAVLARPQMEMHLLNLYRTHSDLIVIFVDPEFETQRWSPLGWRPVRDLVASVDAERVMLLSFGEFGSRSDLGLLSPEGHIYVRDLSPEKVTELIVRRVEAQTPELPSPSPDFKHTTTIPVDILRISRYAPTEFIGREAEISLLWDAWNKAVHNEENRPRVLTFVGLGGEGKTSLVAEWAAQLGSKNWPGCEAVFAWSFYSQGAREEAAVSSDSFIDAALRFFGDSQPSAGPPWERGHRLARFIGNQKTLLILDGLEPLQDPRTGELKDAGLVALLKGLVTSSQGLCVITTRHSITDLKAFRQTTAPEVELLRLSREAGVHLLKMLGVKGTPTEFEKLVDDVKGHALTLNLLGTYLRNAHAGDIGKRHFLKLEEADSQEFGRSSFRLYAAYLRWLETEGEEGKQAIALLRLMGFFDRAARVDYIQALLRPPAISGLTEPLINIGEPEKNIALQRLEDTNLLTVNRDASGTNLTLDTHPLLREHFAQLLKASDAWREGHRRIYEHLCETTIEGDTPTVEDLQPLCHAVVHASQADLHQRAFEEVYLPRLQRNKEGYLWRKLGAFSMDLGVITYFFEQPWSKVTSTFSDEAKGHLLYNAAFDLRALGRLSEALEPMREALNVQIMQQDWRNAATSAANLSELELTLGEVAAAMRDAEQSVQYADRSGDQLQRRSKLETLGEALHQGGRRPEAETVFREAEQSQTEHQTEYPLLYSTGGFRYCDLLLTIPEQTAWQTILQVKRHQDLESAAVSCRAVSERATQTLKWISKHGRDILSPALDHLTLGRVALYETILIKAKIRDAKSEIENALNGLRQAGQLQELPRGLLTRAWMRFLENEVEAARTDLDEAWEIAERGPMRLHMADIHLYRARLFHGVKPYPWASPHEDLKAARKLIEQSGYWRRKEELEDAEAANSRLRQSSSSAEQTMKREKVLVSYSHNDKKLFLEFKKMLAPAIRRGVVDIWDDTRIAPGARWKEEIEKALQSAKIAVLLVSPNFLDSEFISKHELPPLLKAAQDEGVTIFWIYLDYCLYEETEIAGYQAAHDVSRPLSALSKPERGAVLSETCARLIRLLNDPAEPARVEAGVARDSESSDAAAQGSSSDEFSDKTVRRVAVALDQAKPLTMRTLVLNLDVLFNRGTFRFEPLRECVTQEWGRRLLPAMETLELLRRYSSLVSDQAPDNETFEKLMDEVNGYCLAMATQLFEEPVKVSEMRDYLGTAEFLKRLPQGKLWNSAAEIDEATNTRVDGPRIRAVEQMDHLRKEFLS